MTVFMKTALFISTSNTHISKKVDSVDSLSYDRFFIPQALVWSILAYNPRLDEEFWKKWFRISGADPENFSRGCPTLSKIDSVWRITVEVHKYEK